MFVDQLPYVVFWEGARLGDARDLEQRGGRGDVGIEAAGRGGDEVNRHRGRRVLGGQLRGIGLDPVQQRLRRRAGVRSGRVGGVVRRRHRLAAVSRVGIRGGGRAAVEVGLGSEVLSDQRR